MTFTNKTFSSAIVSVISVFTLAGCGTTVQQIPVPYYDVNYAQAYQQQNPSCCCQCNNQQTNNQTTPVTNPSTPVTTVSNPPTTITPVKTPATTEVVKPTNPVNNTPTVKPTATPAPAVSTASKGRQALDKAMSIISNANALEATIEKYEKNLKDGTAITQSLSVWTKKPGSVKLEVTAHTKSSSVGAKVTYKVGTGKATVRPGGALSFITKEMDQTDSNITSPNEYTPEQVDFFSMVKRLSGQEYKAELTGKTTVNGTEVYLIKVTTDNNSFDSRITHEMIGFDPKTFEVKLWEAYTADSAEAYFRITIKTFKILSDLADSTFKV